MIARSNVTMSRKEACGGGSRISRRPGAHGLAGRLLLLLTAVAFLLTPARAAGDALARGIDAALADKRLRGATVGVCVQALGTGRVLYSRNAAAMLIPASNQKILTAATALRELGADYRFETALMAVDAQDARDGTLDRGLILRGGGDPTLGSALAGEEPLEQFEAWADALLAMGVRRVGGGLVVDDTLLDRRHIHPDWPEGQLWRKYCAPVSAASLGENCVTVTVKPGARAGDPAVVTLFPAVPFLKASNRCKTRQKSHTIWFAREADSLIITVGGSVRLGSSGYAGRVAVPHPALFTGAALAQVLEAKGIALEGAVRLAGAADLARREGWHALAVRHTPLDRVLPLMLAWSQNMYAEHVIKAVGARGGTPGSWQTGLARTAAMLAEQGFTAGSFELADGSGLSRRNRASAGLLCAVLVAQDRSESGKKLADMMGVAGVNGTLRKRLARAPYKGNVRAKTGYIRGVGALSGYANAKSGARVAFSILINDSSPPMPNWAMKEIEDRIVRAIVDHAE